MRYILGIAIFTGIALFFKGAGDVIVSGGYPTTHAAVVLTVALLLIIGHWHGRRT